MWAKIIYKNPHKPLDNSEAGFLEKRFWIGNKRVFLSWNIMHKLSLAIHQLLKEKPFSYTTNFVVAFTQKLIRSNSAICKLFLYTMVKNSLYEVRLGWFTKYLWAPASEYTPALKHGLIFY